MTALSSLPASPGGGRFHRGATLAPQVNSRVSLEPNKKTLGRTTRRAIPSHVCPAHLEPKGSGKTESTAALGSPDPSGDPSLNRAAGFPRLLFVRCVERATPEARAEVEL